MMGIEEFVEEFENDNGVPNFKKIGVNGKQKLTLPPLQD